MNCIIVEDQLPAQRILTKYITDAGTLNLVGTFTDALEAMKILKSEKIDVMFLDIHLPKLSGIDFLKTLPNPPQVILTTAFSEYALESYELNVVDYLLKPFSFQRFIQAISKLSMQPHTSLSSSSNISSEESPIATKNHSEEIFIKSGYDYIRIKTDDIIFIMADSDYTELHLTDKMHLSTESLRYWEDFLPKQKFMRIHKSYIINTTKISKVSGNQIFLENDKNIPIGRAYKNDFMERFM